MIHIQLSFFLNRDAPSTRTLISGVITTIRCFINGCDLEYTQPDPQDWNNEWEDLICLRCKRTIRWDRRDHTDVHPRSTCFPILHRHIRGWFVDHWFSLKCRWTHRFLPKRSKITLTDQDSAAGNDLPW